jgi:hypothetical protein
VLLVTGKENTMSKRDDLKHVLQMAREHGMSDDALIDAILSNTKDPEPAPGADAGREPPPRAVPLNPNTPGRETIP